MVTEIGMFGGYGFQGQVTTGDGSDKKYKMGAGYINLRRKKKKQQCKVGREEEGSSSASGLADRGAVAVFVWQSAAAIEILRKRIAAETATFLVKVKAHRGEPANEGADILADKAISDPKVGKEWCHQTNRAVLTWEKPCREAGKVTY